MELISVMVQRLATEMGVSRLEQDEFSLRSHQLAARAFDKGYITDIFPYESKLIVLYCIIGWVFQ